MTEQLTASRASTAPDDRPRRPASTVLWWVAAAVTGTALVVTRLTGITRSLWWDEAFTAGRYVDGGAEVIFDASRYVANNHVLYSLLSSWTSELLWPGDGILRLWTVGPALLGAGLVGWWAWRHLSPAVAVTATALLVLSPLAVRLQTEARGYGLVLLSASVLLVVTAARVGDAPPRWRDDLAVATAGLVGMLTFPPVVFLYVAHTGVWFLRRGAHRLRLVLLTAASGAVTFAVLRPLFGPMLDNASTVGSRAADPITWWSPIVGPLTVLGGPSFDAFLPGGEGWAAAIAIAFGILGTGLLLVGSTRTIPHPGSGRRNAGLQLVAALGVSIAMLGLVGFSLLDRYVAFAFPAALVAVAVGLVGLVRLITGGRGLATAVVVIALLAVAAVPGLPAARVETLLPRQNFAAAVDEVADLDPETVVVRHLHVGYAWYLDRQGIEEIRTDDGAEATAAFCGGERPTVYLPDPDREPEDGPTCLDDAVRRSVPQSGASGEMVWYELR